MRRDNTHYVIFPEYFDRDLTRKEGRRLPLKEALENPTLLELKLAAQKLEYNYETREDAAYPRLWWDKKGLIYVEKRTSKLKTIRDMSSEIHTYIRPALEKQKHQLIEKAKKRKIGKTRPSKTDETKRKPKDFRPKRRR
ncbi:MAG: signal recognition particle subunit SRP19/SEC65 family protein [Candidatus Hodarchaeota archaeon]